MNKELLALLIIIAIYIISIFVFAAIYHSYSKDSPDISDQSFINALYTSVTIQSLVGLSDPPNSKVRSLQIWVIIQSTISYFVSIGIVLILVKILFKDENSIEMKIEKKMNEMKDLIQQLQPDKLKKKN
jgi:hypothetical protein